MTLWAARLAALRPGPEPLSSAKRRRRRDDLDCLDSGLDCVVGVVDAVCMSAGTVWGAVMGGDNGWSSLSGSLAFVSYGVCSCGLERDNIQKTGPMQARRTHPWARSSEDPHPPGRKRDPRDLAAGSMKTS